MIANSGDVANVPVGAGLSAAICLREGIIYLKTIQNGSPMLLGYKLAPLEGEQTNETSSPKENNEMDKKISAILEDYGRRLEVLEKQAAQPVQPQKKGGNSVWPTI